jgi:hypothetical protein
VLLFVLAATAFFFGNLFRESESVDPWPLFAALA